MAKLKTEIDTPEMEARIAEAFKAWAITPWDGTGDEPQDPEFFIFYEHGQWWINVPIGGGHMTYSVVDAVGGDSVDGFSFEEVS